MSFSRSQQETVTESLTENVQRNLNVADSDQAVTVAETGGDVTIIQTDQNAFDRASDLAMRSVEVGETIARDTIELTQSVLRMGYESSHDTQELVAGASGAALDTSLSFASRLQTSFQNTISSTVDALQRIGVEQNKSTDQRLSEVSESAIKYVVISVAVVALAAVGFVMFRRS